MEDADGPSVATEPTGLPTGFLQRHLERHPEDRVRSVCVGGRHHWLAPELAWSVSSKRR